MTDPPFATVRPNSRKPARLCRALQCDRERSAKTRDGARVYQSRFCSRHRMMKWRADNPITAAFCTLRDHAKLRGREFTLMPGEFRALAADAGYDATSRSRRESGAQCLSVDRIDHTRGYVPGNVRIITLSVNSRKGNHEKHGRDWKTDLPF